MCIGTVLVQKIDQKKKKIDENYAFLLLIFNKYNT